MNTNTQRIEVFYDGIEGQTHTYGGADSGCDFGGMGYGRTYQEAVDDALDFLADSEYHIDLSDDSATSVAVWAEVKRSADKLGIDLTSEHEVEEIEAELAADFVKREGMTAEQAEKAVLYYLEPVQLGIVIRFHGFLEDA